MVKTNIKSYRLILLLVVCVLGMAQTDPTATWPTSPVGPSNIPLAVDSSASPLQADINNVTSSIPVLDGTRFRIYQMIRLNAEKMQVTNIVGNTLTATRGYGGTTATSHSATGASCSSAPTYPSCVRGEIFAWIPNKLRAELIAMQASLRPSFDVSSLPAVPSPGCVPTAHYTLSTDKTLYRCNDAGTGYDLISAGGGGGGTSEDPNPISTSGWASSGTETVLVGTHARGLFARGECLMTNAGPKDEIVGCVVERNAAGDLFVTYETKPDKFLVYRGEKAAGPAGPTGPAGPGIGALLTVKGDTVVHNGSSAVRHAVCADGEVRIADSSQATGWRCTAPPGGVSVCSATGTTAQTCTPSPALLSCGVGTTIVLVPASTTTGAVTLSATGCTANLPITRGPTGLVNGELRADSTYIIVRTSTGFQIQMSAIVAGDDTLIFDYSTYPPTARVGSGIFGDLNGPNTWAGAQTYNVPPRIVPTVVASAPTCNAGAEGKRASFTDSNTATWGAVIAGGGSNHVGGYCNGTSWTVYAK